MLPVEVIPDPAPTGETNTDPGQFPALSSSSCCVEFRHGKVTLENPSPELLAVLLREKPMISLPSGTRIWLVAGVTDMRKSFNGLGELVHMHLMKIRSPGTCLSSVAAKVTP